VSVKHDRRYLMIGFLEPVERRILRQHHRLRVSRFVGTASDFYTRVTRRRHPKARQ